MLNLNELSRNVHIIVWEAGDLGRRGHGQSAAVAVAIYLPKQYDFAKFLLRFEDMVKERIGIDMSNWFTEEDDDRLPDDDRERLQELGIDAPSGSMDVYDFFKLWCAIVPVAFPGSLVLPGNFGNYLSMTGGYGLWDSKINRMEDL